MDGVALTAGEQFYVEILAKHGHRKARPVGEADATPGNADAA